MECSTLDAVLVEKFSNWIRRLHRDLLQSGDLGPKGWGSKSELARRLGVDKGDMSRWLDQSKAPNVTLENFEQIMLRARPEQDLMRTFREIMGEREIVKSPSNIALLEDRYREAWERLFRGNLGRARRVLYNMEDQEDQQITELISEVVRAVLYHGPAECLQPIADILGAYQESEEISVRRKRTRALRLRRYKEVAGENF